MTLSFSDRNRRFEFFDALGLLGLVGLLVARFIPVARLPFWGCVLRQHTGWPCPGCGLTRSADRLVHGNISKAFDANPLGTAVYFALGLVAVWMVLHMAFAVPTPRLEVSEKEATRLRWAAFAALGLNYLFVIIQTRFS